MNEHDRARPDLGPAGDIVGQSHVTSRGYFIRVEHMDFTNDGDRVRVTLLRKTERGTEFIRMMDFTPQLAIALEELLHKANG